MNEIKIFVTHSPNANSIRPQIPFFDHITAGSVFQQGPLPKGMLRDNSGTHISEKNKSCCELTTQYWAWKNVTADHYGFCHYRRYFSFSPELLPEAGCGSIVLPYLDKKARKMLCLEEKDIRAHVEQYDFLIAKAVPTEALYAKNVYEHYRQAPGLHVEDLDLFCQILYEKYPHMQKAAKAYLNGARFYPCNMFIMNRELFHWYASMLFDLLDAYEQQAAVFADKYEWQRFARDKHTKGSCDTTDGPDTKRYSREGLRTPGHLGERFLGIFYEYIRQLGTWKVKELQMALIEHTQRPAARRPDHQEIPIVSAANASFVPALFVCLRSLADCTDPRRRYHIYIFHTDIRIEDQLIFQTELENEQIRVDFIDVGMRIAGYRLKAKGKITAETYYRFLILDVLKDCPKAVWLDCDLIIRRDVAQLYDLDLDGYWLAAAVDPDFAGQCNGANPDTARYCQQTLQLKDPFQYVQAGVLVFHICEMQKKVRAKQLFAMAQQGNYRYSDQDLLNIVCEGKIRRLPMAWNMMTDRKNMRYTVIRSAPADLLEDYEQARKQPYIIHYAGSPKPWEAPDMDFAREFWETARNTPYYETLLAGITRQAGKLPFAEKFAEQAVGAAVKAVKKMLPQHSRIRWAAGKLYWKLK